MVIPMLTKRFDCGNVVLGELGGWVLRCVVNSELFPELPTLDHLSNGRNRSLGALIPPWERWFLQVGTVINPDGLIPSKPPGHSPLKIDPEESVMRAIVVAATS